MKSKISIAGHPVHPMFVSIPIGAYILATACFIAYRFFIIDSFWFKAGVAANGAGVLMGVVVAIVGYLDFTLSIPKNTPARVTGFVHALWNSAAIFFFAVNFLVQYQKWDNIRPDPGSSVLLSVLGLACTMVAGYFGFKMVQKFHVGVDLTPEQEQLDHPSFLPRESFYPNSDDQRKAG